MPPIPPFNGFPNGPNGRVIVPERFFSDLLPAIDDLAELKLTLYAFWLLHQREGDYRYFRLRDVLGDVTFMAGMGPAPEDATRAALARAVQRGTLLEVLVDSAPVYFMNTEKGRLAVAALQRGDWLPSDHPDQPIAGIVERPNIFTLYEQNIGPLTPLLAETLADAERTYPPDWIADAVRAAVEGNKRSWRYIEAILRRWQTEGRGASSPQASPPAAEIDPFLAQDERLRNRGGKGGG